MIAHIDAYYIAAQARFVRQVRKGTILLLEGPTDARIFERFIDRNACEIEIGFGKKNVLGALDIWRMMDFPASSPLWMLILIESLK